MKATYYLDGNEISPEDLAGKSGKVKIRLDYTSNETVTKEVNGKDEDISVPFVAVSGMVLGNNFKNIQVTMVNTSHRARAISLSVMRFLDWMMA